jgi:hypothetical protein
MRVEILHIDDCPNWQEAGSRVRAVLDETGHRDIEVRYRLLTSSSDAVGTAFAGSPTIVVDDEDLFPSEGATQDLACRIYATPTGFAGLPTQEQIRGAIVDHAA